MGAVSIINVLPPIIVEAVKGQKVHTSFANQLWKLPNCFKEASHLQNDKAGNSRRVPSILNIYKK